MHNLGVRAIAILVMILVLHKGVDVGLIIVNLIQIIICAREVLVRDKLFLIRICLQIVIVWNRLVRTISSICVLGFPNSDVQDSK